MGKLGRLAFAAAMLIGGPDCSAPDRSRLFVREPGRLEAERTVTGQRDVVADPLVAGDCVFGLAGWKPQTAVSCRADGVCSGPAEAPVAGDPNFCVRFIPAKK
jgi:hypothetical protein